MISTPELIVFFRLLVAHILADFFLQRYNWIVDKRTGVSSPYLYVHIFIVGLLTYLLLADWTQWQLPLFIMITHFLIDWWKSSQKADAKYFIIDQLLHLLMLVIGWWWYIGFNLPEIGNWGASLLQQPSLWVILTGYLLILRPVGFLIGKATDSWQKELAELPSTYQGLNKAGTWIGYFERFIILTFLIVGQYSAIGFLIAAKSVFRFSGKSDDDYTRKEAEYILIGTLLSFLLAISIGIAVVYFKNYQS